MFFWRIFFFLYISLVDDDNDGGTCPHPAIAFSPMVQQTFLFAYRFLHVWCARVCVVRDHPFFQFTHLRRRRRVFNSFHSKMSVSAPRELLSFFIHFSAWIRYVDIRWDSLRDARLHKWNRFSLLRSHSDRARGSRAENKRWKREKDTLICVCLHRLFFGYLIYVKWIFRWFIVIVIVRP